MAQAKKLTRVPLLYRNLAGNIVFLPLRPSSFGHNFLYLLDGHGRFCSTGFTLYRHKESLWRFGRQSGPCMEYVNPRGLTGTNPVTPSDLYRASQTETRN